MIIQQIFFSVPYSLKVLYKVLNCFILNFYRSFPTVLVNFPDFATRDVHTNYIDCVRWWGKDVVISKVRNKNI